MTGPAAPADRHGGALAPVVDARARLLVLGSLPGIRSLSEQRYYAHARNQFWPLMAAVIDQPLPAMPYDTRLAMLREAGVGLWDVIGAAERRGSLDAAIRAPVTNDLRALLAELPRLRAIAFNGAKAAALGRRIIGDGGGVAVITLPSSSAALTVPIAVKQQAWSALRAFLGPEAGA